MYLSQLMRDLLTGNGSEATKAVLLNACAEKRNAQLVCGPEGQGYVLAVIFLSFLILPYICIIKFKSWCCAV